MNSKSHIKTERPKSASNESRIVTVERVPPSPGLSRMKEELAAQMTEDTAAITTCLTAVNQSLIRIENTLSRLNLPTSRDMEQAVRSGMTELERLRSGYRALIYVLVILSVFLLSLGLYSRHQEEGLRIQTVRAQWAETRLSQMDQFAQQSAAVSAGKLLTTLYETQTRLIVEGEAVFLDRPGQRRVQISPSVRPSR